MRGFVDKQAELTYDGSTMKVLLVHPRIDGVEPPIRRTESLGLGYIAAVLRRDGHEVEMLDAYLRAMGHEEMMREILSRDFDCLGLTAYDVHKQTLMAIARTVRKKKKDVIIGAGGYFPTFAGEKLIAACPDLDFIVRGEGETVASEVFGRIARSEEWRDVPGVAYLKDGVPVLNPLPPLVQDLDSLPFPARDEINRVERGLPALILSSRGCYHRCAFCSIPSFYALHGGRAPRYRSPENLLDEIETVIRTTGINEFVFADDNFIGPGQKSRERVYRIADEMRARKLNFTFTIECRVDEIDEDILKLLKEVGLTRVFMGIESGVQQQLDRYNKRTTVEQNRRAIEMVRGLGLGFYAGFIMIDPYTTLGELVENVQFVREMGLSEGPGRLPLEFMSRLGLYGGVPIVNKLRTDGLLREKGMNRTYVFKHWSFRVTAGMASVLAAVVDFVRHPTVFLRRSFGRQPSAYSE